MPKLLFKEGTILFVGGYPEHVDEAKAYVKKHGYTKEDVRVFKKKEEYTPMNGGEKVEFTNVLVETLRPIAIECGVVGCPNHEPEEKEENNGSENTGSE